MEISVQEKTKKRMVFSLKGSTHTICNSIKDELWLDKDVTAAAYHVDHPLIGIPKFIIETNGKDPASVLADACTRLMKKNDELASALKKLKW